MVGVGRQEGEGRDEGKWLRLRKAGDGEAAAVFESLVQKGQKSDRQAGWQLGVGKQMFTILGPKIRRT